MARVPGNDPVTASSIGVSRTVLPNVRRFDESTFRNQGAAAEALVQVGQTLGAIGTDLFKEGVILQRKEEKRQGDDGFLELQKEIARISIGTPDEPGYLKTQGAIAVEQYKAAQQQIAEAKLRISGNLKSEVARRQYNSKSGAAQHMANVRHSEHAVNQQRIAQGQTDQATIIQQQLDDLEEVDPNSLLAQARQIERIRGEGGMIDTLLQMRQRAGQLDPIDTELAIQAMITKHHAAMIQKMLDEKDGVGAAVYFQRVDIAGEISSAARGGLVKKIKAGAILQQSQQAVDKVFSDPELAEGTAKERMDALRALPIMDENPEIQKQAEKNMRLRNAEIERDRIQEERIQLEDAVEFVQNGGKVTDLPPDILEQVNRKKGMRAVLDELEADRAAGRPRRTDDVEYDRLVRMFTDDPEEFQKQDLMSDPKYVKAFLRPDALRLVALQVFLSKGEARKRSASGKEQERAARQSRVVSATRAQLDALKLTKERRGQVISGVMRGVDRRHALGDKLDEAEYRRMVNAAVMMKGEALGEGFFDDPDILLLDAVNDPTRTFTGEDFTEENAPFIADLHQQVVEGGSVKVEFELRDVVDAVAELVARPVFPTPFTVAREINRQAALLRRKQAAALLVPAPAPAPAPVSIDLPPRTPAPVSIDLPPRTPAPVRVDDLISVLKPQTVLTGEERIDRIIKELGLDKSSPERPLKGNAGVTEYIPASTAADIWGVAYQTEDSPQKKADFIADVARFRNSADEEVITLIQDTVEVVFAGDEGANLAQLQDIMVQIALHESQGFEFRKQLSGGPARGIHQVEPETALSLISNSTLLGPKARSMLKSHGLDISKPVTLEQLADKLETNDVISTIFATAKLLSGAKATDILASLQ